MLIKSTAMMALVMIAAHTYRADAAEGDADEPTPPAAPAETTTPELIGVLETPHPAMPDASEAPVTTEAPAPVITDGSATAPITSGDATPAPAAGASTTVPAAGDATTAPAAGASTTVPAAGASTTVPAAGDATTAPAAGASTTAPAGTDANGSSTAASTTTDAPQPSDTTATEAAAVLTGKWAGPCVRLYPQPQDGGFIDTTTQRSGVVFAGTTVTVTADVFRKLDCASPNYTMTVVSDYALGAEANGVTPIDYTLHSIKITYKDAFDIADINDAAFCGFTDWKVGEPKDVSGRVCFDDDPALPKDGDRLFDVAQVEAQKLYFGLATQTAGSVKPGPHDGSTADKRPVAVDRSQFLTPVTTVP